MLTEETPVEGKKNSLYKERQFPSRQSTEFFLGNQQGIYHTGKWQDLPWSHSMSSGQVVIL